MMSVVFDSIHGTAIDHYGGENAESITLGDGETVFVDKWLFMQQSLVLVIMLAHDETKAFVVIQDKQSNKQGLNLTLLPCY